MLRVCHFDDTDRIPHGSVDVVLAFGGLVKGHLKENTSVEIIKSDYIQVFDIAFIARPFGIKFGCPWSNVSSLSKPMTKLALIRPFKYTSSGHYLLEDIDFSKSGTPLYPLASNVFLDRVPVPW